MTMRTKVATLALASLAGLGGGLLGPELPAGARPKATTVTAVETEFHIALSKSTFTPGTYVFVAENKGTITHALEITGPGVHSATRDLAPGQSARLRVTFKSGRYDVFCPVPGHKAMGMNVNLVISSHHRATAAGTTTPGSGGDGS
ncbi:MAG TPA: plastocyanin/azurin family copper-binding protein [Acidimicrobiales bacterium]|nr:plastocyanin/azurin family copper-binding protein [Acidimicrobiales bacterium]